MQAISIRELLEQCKESLGLELRAGAEGLSRSIRIPRIQKPGLALTGYEEQLDVERLLTLGGTEIDFLHKATDEQRKLGIDTMLGARPAAIVVTRGLQPPADLTDCCDSENVPLLVSTLVSSEFILNVTHVLQNHLSPKTSVHGVFLEVLGIGVLLRGKSGVGKSEAALDLIVRGNRLVADDVVEVRRVGANLLMGAGTGIIKHHMEIRGLGVINIKDLFGIAAVREQHQIDLVIELCEWKDTEARDRLGVDDEDYEILGEEVPLLRVPVRPGRNLATIIEVAARNQTLKHMGHNSAKLFQQRLNAAIAGATPRE